MFKLRDLENGYPNQLFLKISKIKQQKAWTKVQHYSNPTTCGQAYLNYLCYQTFILWLKGWLETENPLTNNSVHGQNKNFISDYDFPEIWEFINGSIINYQGMKLALIPNDSTDIEEVDIPQEWVDIPQWQADYYLFVQVNLDFADESWMRVLGYISYFQLRKKADYNKRDRIYYINQKYLEEDITDILLYPQTITHNQQQLITARSLSLATANNLIEKLGNSSVYYPRLAIPFDQWAMLITNTEWRRKLDHKRTKIPQLSSAINLKQWLKEVVDTVEIGWHNVEELFTPIEPIYVRDNPNSEATITKETINPLIQLLQANNSEKERIQAAGILGKIGQGYPEVIEALTELLDTAKEAETRWEAALSLGKIDPGNPKGAVQKGKLIDLGIQLEAQKIVLIVAIMPQSKDRVGVWIQVKPIDELSKLPPDLKLTIISEEKTILEAKARSDTEGKGKDKCLQFRFTPPQKTHFQVQVTFKNASFTEYFDA